MVPLLALACARSDRPDAGDLGSDRDPSRRILLVTFENRSERPLSVDELTRALGSGEQTVVFERHYVASPDVGDSLRSVLTGYAPSMGRVEGRANGSVADRPTLAGLFAETGFETFAVMGHPAAGPSSGLERGFERYDHRAGRSAEQALLAARSALDRSGPTALGVVELTVDQPQALVEALRLLTESRRYAETLVVVTGLRGAAGQPPLRESAIRVPLVVKFPSGERPETLPPRVRAISSALDLVPSLLAFAGRETVDEWPGADAFDGRSSGWAIVEAEQAWAFLQDNFKIVVEGERARVYDLAEDPDERDDLSDRRPRRARALVRNAQATREAWIRVKTGSGDPTVDDETLQHLRSLGYVQ
jgi:arylsulfatase A-like enzyme